MDAKGQTILSTIYAKKEGFNNMYPWFKKLKEQNLNPLYIAIDGEQSATRAIKTIWPQAKIQRCLFHIQREGMRWLRTYPKTEAGKDLRRILSTLCAIRTDKERDTFIASYENWLTKYKDFIKSLTTTTIAFKELKRTTVLIKNALPNMFRFLEEPNIPSTTNALESFYSRLKADYRRHRGLTQKHKIHYLTWYGSIK
ncbi:MAG: transposase [Candidatus Omnitrophota bacterium]